ncbi:DgyrCDS7479 [Dimorphilus gyrociliatus]|uniref:DgyrCDS7479 n=1 Tax=Dimorphilus gyrociliatus TaxID=2664684 RepID=A0A7I8VRB8_9ANNE|nr:DgyrCDS7479 [Dimorphilus gyrociliatus]
MSEIEVDFVSDLMITEMESVLEELDGITDGKISNSTELCRHLYSLSEDTQLDCSLCESLSVQRAVAEARRSWMRNKPLECIIDGKSLPDLYHGVVGLRRIIQPSITKIALNAVVNFRSEAHKCIIIAENPNVQAKEAGSVTEKIQTETFRQVTSYIDFLFNLETDRSEKASKGIIKFAQNGSQTDIVDQLMIQEFYDDGKDNIPSNTKYKKDKKKKKKKHKKKEKRSKVEDKVENVKAPLPAMIVYPGMDKMVNDEDRAALLRAGAISEDIRTIKVVKKDERQNHDMARKECESAYDEFAKELELMTERSNHDAKSTKKHLFPAADQYLPKTIIPTLSGIPPQLCPPSQVDVPQPISKASPPEKVIPKPVEPEDDGTLDSILISQLEYFAQNMESLLKANNSNESANRIPLNKCSVKIKESSRMNELLATTIQALCGNTRKKLKGSALHHVAAIDDVDTSMKRQWNEIVKDMDQIYDTCIPPPPKPKKIKLSTNGFLPPDFDLPIIPLRIPPKRIKTFELCERNIYRLLDLALVNIESFMREVKLNVKEFDSSCVQPGMCLPWALTLALDPRSHSASLSPSKENDNPNELGDEKKTGLEEDMNSINPVAEKETTNISATKTTKLTSRNSLAAAFRQAIEAKKRASKEQQNQKRKLPIQIDVKPAKKLKSQMFIPPGQLVTKDNHAKTNVTANKSLSEMLETLDRTLVDDVGTNLMTSQRNESLVTPKLSGFSRFALGLFKQLPKSTRNDPFATKFRKAKFEEVNVFKAVEPNQTSKATIQSPTEKDHLNTSPLDNVEMEIDSNSEHEVTQEEISETYQDFEKPTFEPFRFESRHTEPTIELPLPEVFNATKKLLSEDPVEEQLEHEVNTQKQWVLEQFPEAPPVIPIPPPPVDPLPAELSPVPPAPSSPPLDQDELRELGDPEPKEKTNEDSVDIPLPPENPESNLDDVPLPDTPAPKDLPDRSSSAKKTDSSEDAMDLWKKKCQELMENSPNTLLPPPIITPGQPPLLPPPPFPLFPPDKNRPPMLLLPPPPILPTPVVRKRPKEKDDTGKFRNLKVYVWKTDNLDAQVRKYLLENGGEEIDPFQVMYLKSTGMKKDILVFINKEKLNRLHLLPNVSILRKVLNIHFLAFGSLDDVQNEQCTEVMMKGGLLLPDDKALLQTHPATLELLVEFMVQQKEKNNNWQLAIHQFNLDTMELMRENLKGNESKIKRLHKVENILNRYMSLGVVRILDRHLCDAHAKPASELLNCAIDLQSSSDFYQNHRHVIVVTDMESSSQKMCMFAERGVGVMSMEKFVSGVVGKKPENPSRIVDPDFGIRVARYFTDAQPSNAVVKLKWNFASVGK